MLCEFSAMLCEFSAMLCEFSAMLCDNAIILFIYITAVSAVANDVPHLIYFAFSGISSTDIFAEVALFMPLIKVLFSS